MTQTPSANPLDAVGIASIKANLKKIGRAEFSKNNAMLELYVTHKQDLSCRCACGCGSAGLSSYTTGTGKHYLASCAQQLLVAGKAIVQESRLKPVTSDLPPLKVTEGVPRWVSFYPAMLEPGANYSNVGRRFGHTPGSVRSAFMVGSCPAPIRQQVQEIVQRSQDHDQVSRDHICKILRQPRPWAKPITQAIVIGG